jgi:transposase
LLYHGFGIRGYRYVRTIKCHDCNAVRQTPIALTDPRRTYTRSFAQYVLDLETGMIVHVGHGKGGDALVDFWKRLHRCGAKIEAIATDMSPAYIDAVMTHLPNAVLVFDRFHVMKLFNEKLSNLRRDLYRAANAKPTAFVTIRSSP